MVLEEQLQESSYDRMIFSQKVDVAFQHFYALAQAGRGVSPKVSFRVSICSILLHQDLVINL